MNKKEENHINTLKMISMLNIQLVILYEEGQKTASLCKWMAEREQRWMIKRQTLLRATKDRKEHNS